LIASSKESWNRKNSPKGADFNAPVSWGRRITDLASVIILSHLLRTAFALALHKRAGMTQSYLKRGTQLCGLFRKFRIAVLKAL
jgi:hypothetical protein